MASLAAGLHAAGSTLPGTLSYLLLTPAKLSMAQYMWRARAARCVSRIELGGRDLRTPREPLLQAPLFTCAESEKWALAAPWASQTRSPRSHPGSKPRSSAAEGAEERARERGQPLTQARRESSRAGGRALTGAALARLCLCVSWQTSVLGVRCRCCMSRFDGALALRACCMGVNA